MKDVVLDEDRALVHVLPARRLRCSTAHSTAQAGMMPTGAAAACAWPGLVQGGVATLPAEPGIKATRRQRFA